jgi:GntR family transcriptional regulator, vanillate catabolism transcriptional regulator
MMKTQTQLLAAKIRHMIVCGEYAAGDKLREHDLAKQLDVSRTPVRLALSELEQQGLLAYAPNRGFVAKAFTVEEILDAVDVRERLEGMAVGVVAMRGATDVVVRALESCLLQVDGLLARDTLKERDAATWIEINGVFHETIVQAAGNRVLSDAVARIELVPLASPRRFIDMFMADRFRDAMIASQLSHRWIFDAILARDIARAESVMRQHIHESRNRLKHFLEESRADPRVANDASLRRIVDTQSKHAKPRAAQGAE